MGPEDALARILQMKPDEPEPEVWPSLLHAVVESTGGEWSAFIEVSGGVLDRVACWPDDAPPCLASDAAITAALSGRRGWFDAGAGAVAAVRVPSGAGRSGGVLVCGGAGLTNGGSLWVALEAAALRAALIRVRRRTEARLRRDEELALSLIRISQALGDAPDLRSGLEQLCHTTCELLPISAAAVTLLDREQGVFVREAQVGLPELWLESYPRLARAAFEAHAHVWEPIGIFEGEALARLPGASLHKELQLTAIAQTVLRAGGEVIGMFSVCAFGQQRHFPAEERLWIQILGHRVAEAVRAARLSSAIAASEARYRNMVQSCHEGIWVIGVDRRLSFVNPQLAHMLGYTPDEMIGHFALEFMDPSVHQEARERFARRQRGIRERWATIFRHKDGREVWVSSSSAPLHDDRGQFAGVVSFITDESERRRLEAKMQQVQSLESLGVLAGGIAHDFNNLLVGVLGNAGLARAELRPGSPIEPMLSGIETAAMRAAELTRQMLAYAGKGKLVVRALDLNVIIREMAELLSAAVSKRAQLRLELAPTLPAVQGDATQIRQVVMNLITNASDALVGEAGQILVRTSVMQATRADLDTLYLDEQLAEGDYVMLEVVDTGVGMDVGTQARMFEPFFTTKFAGRGLGLAAVLGILRSHRGGVKVESAPGKGTTMRVLLPASPEAERAAEKRQPPVPSAAGRGTVLVVDDDPLVREVALRALSANGFDVLSADGGESALELADRGTRIGAIILDVTMPGIPLEELVPALRQRLPKTPIVLSSGYDESEARRHLPAGGFEAFLQKPWTARDLLAVVRAVSQ